MNYLIINSWKTAYVFLSQIAFQWDGNSRSRRCPSFWKIASQVFESEKLKVASVSSWKSTIPGPKAAPVCLNIPPENFTAACYLVKPIKLIKSHDWKVIRKKMNWIVSYPNYRDMQASDPRCILAAHCKAYMWMNRPKLNAKRKGTRGNVIARGIIRLLRD